MTVTAVNDPPVVSVIGSTTITEDVLTTVEFDIVDVDIGAGDIFVRLTGTNVVLTLPVTTGLMLTGGVSTGAVLEFTADSLANADAALAALQVQGAPTNYAGPASIDIHADDLGASGAPGSQTFDGTFPLTIVDANDPPVITAPSGTSFSFVGSVEGALPANVADDYTTSTIDITLTAVNGVVRLPTTTGLTLVGGISQGTSVQFQATVADATAALADMRYTLDADETVSGSLTVLADDLGNTGSGGALTDTLVFTITSDITCGDGVSHPTNEACDDGNLVAGDGCDATCNIEANAFCTEDGNLLSTCTTFTLTLTSGSDETDVIDGTLALRLVLGGTSGETWDTAVGSAGAATDALIAALVGTLGGTYAWEALIRPLLDASHVTRVDGATVDVTIPATATYAIDANDGIAVTSVGAAALTSGVSASGFSTAVGITDTAPTASMTSAVGVDCTTAGSAFTLVSASTTIDVVIRGSTWASAMWAIDATALSYFDELQMVSSAEFAVLTLHMTDASRPDRLDGVDVALVDAHTVRVTFPESPPCFLEQLGTQRTPTLSASSTTAGIAVAVPTHCALAFP